MVTVLGSGRCDKREREESLGNFLFLPSNYRLFVGCRDSATGGRRRIRGEDLECEEARAIRRAERKESEG